MLLRASIVFLCLSTVVVSAFAGSEPILFQQRAAFVQAEKAYREGDQRLYEKLKKQLSDYPLVSYLEYNELRRRVKNVSAEKIQDFARKYPDSLLVAKLKYRWIKALANKKDHADFVKHYFPAGNTQLECKYRSALLKRNHVELALQNIEALWLVGHSQPSACDTLFKYWRNTQGMPITLVWQRIRLAMNANQIKLAEYLSRSLPKRDQKAVDLWVRVHHNPRLIKKKQLFKQDHEIYPSILLHGIRKLAYRDLDGASTEWDAKKNKYSFNAKERSRVQRTLALLSAQNHRPEALVWLTSIDPEHEDQRVREWRVRSAIINQDWMTTLATIDWLSEEERNDYRWQYWRGRALEELGFAEEARQVFSRLAENRNYHGFLAADKLNKPYAFIDRPLQFNNVELMLVERMPGIRRAKELYFLERFVDARREWMHATSEFDYALLIRAAKLAQSWGWYSRAIFTAAQSEYWDDVTMRFPLGHKDAVILQAGEFNIEPEWVYGILRQESAFVADARSSQGALGLMQLLPRTGKYIARRNNTRLAHPYELLSADKNIKLGSAYLREMRNRLHDHPVLATAAYNAGNTRVRRWLPEQKSVPADIWIETIPYDETRDYVERVMAYTLIYDWRLDEQTKKLNAYLRPIEPPNASTTQRTSIASADTDKAS